MNTDTKYWLEPLNSNVIDYGTVYTDHNVYTHLGCVLLRCVLGALIILTPSIGIQKFKKIWLVLCMVVFIIFASKYLSYSAQNKVVWKVYLRPIIIYALAGTCIYNDRFDQAGALFIVDALMGLQSRHSAFVCSHINEMNKKK